MQTGPWMRALKFLILLLIASNLLLSTHVVAGTLDSLKAEKFLKQLVDYDSSLTQWVLKSELDKSRRFGIDYRTPMDKFFIQYDIEENIRRLVTRGRLKYQFEIEPLNSGYSRLIFKLAARDYKTAFYFKEDSLTTPYDYYSRDWKEFVTKYMRVRASDPRMFPATAARQLDDFVDSLIVLLQLDEEKAAMLQQQKLDYLICVDTDEIEKVSGFNTRGLAILATDRIITTFPLHKHEVAHLLINLALPKPPLFVHPFMQEGFATAVGGRGGKTPEVISEIGVFLQKSTFMTVEEIRKRKDFQNSDASLSYPLSGVYNSFLLEQWPIDRYLRFYSSLGSVTSKAVPHKVYPDSLPADSLFEAYIAIVDMKKTVRFPDSLPESSPLLDAHWGKVWEDGEDYVFSIRGGIQLTPPDPVRNLLSSEFRAIFPDVRYGGQQFFLEVTKGEVKLFNFYTANLDAFYSTGLSMNPIEVQGADGNFQFILPKRVFPLPLENMTITQ